MTNDIRETNYLPQTAFDKYDNVHAKQLLWLSIKIDNLERSLARFKRENKKIEEIYIELAKKRYVTVLVENDDEIKQLKYQIQNIHSKNKKEYDQHIRRLFIIRQQKQEQFLNDPNLQEQINSVVYNDELLLGERLRYQHKELVMQARIEVTKKLFTKLQHDKSYTVIPHYWFELFSKLRNVILHTQQRDYTKLVENFINEMVDIDGKPLYQKLRDERLESIKKYEIALRSTSALIINLGEAEINNNTIMEAVSRLSEEERRNLAKALKVNNIIFEECGRKVDCDIDILIDAMLYTNNMQAIKILFDAGISQYLEFHNSFPLYKAIQNNKALAFIILNDKNVNQVLKHEVDNTKYCLNSLELVIHEQDIELIKYILNHKFGRELMKKANQQGITPLDIAKSLNNPVLMNILLEASKLQNDNNKLNNKNLKNSNKSKL